jgi:hypothetical protein
MCGADSGVGSVDAIYMGLVYAFYTHAIFLDQTKRSFESLFFGVHILELILCFCTLDALYLYHLVRLECHEQSQQREDRQKGRENHELLRTMLGSGSRARTPVLSSHVRSSPT